MTQPCTVFSMLCFPASCLNVSLALEIFFHSFSQQPIQSRGWIFQCMGHFKNLCVSVCLCMCVCVVLSFVFTVNDSVQSQHASCLNRDGFEQTFIFIHISCKNNANRCNDRESVCLSFPLLWYIHNLFICFLYHQLKCMFLITDN